VIGTEEPHSHDCCCWESLCRQWKNNGAGGIAWVAALSFPRKWESKWAEKETMLEILMASAVTSFTLSSGRLTSSALAFTSMPRNYSSRDRDILVLMISPEHWRMWVITSKCCASNTTHLRSIDLQGLEHLDPSLHWGRSFGQVILLQCILSSQGASTGSRHLFGEGIIKGLFGAACDRVDSDRKTVLCQGVV